MNEKGIYKKKISRSLKGQYFVITWATRLAKQRHDQSVPLPLMMSMHQHPFNLVFQEGNINITCMGKGG